MILFVVILGVAAVVAYELQSNAQSGACNTNTAADASNGSACPPPCFSVFGNDLAGGATVNAASDGCPGNGTGANIATQVTGSIQNVANAIALAEGYNVSGSAPNRYNNPGDLSKGDEHGQNISDYTILPDGEHLIIFASPQDGWNALYIKLQNIIDGNSRVYSPDMTWNEIASKWAGNSSVWVRNVTDTLGVNPNDVFGDYFA